jgi:hypothetical protein
VQVYEYERTLESTWGLSALQKRDLEEGFSNSNNNRDSYSPSAWRQGREADFW